MIWVYKWPPRFPNFRHRSVTRGRTNAAPHPLTNLVALVGIEPRSPGNQPGVVTTSRQWPIRVRQGMVRVISIHVILWRCYSGHTLFQRTFIGHLSDILRRVVIFKYRDVSDFVLNSVTCVTIVITTASRCRPTSLKKIGGQLGKAANEKQNGLTNHCRV